MRAGRAGTLQLRLSLYEKQLARVKGGKIVTDTFLAYLISLGIIGAGVCWIVVGMNSTVCIGIGIASIAVGAASFLNELR
jgi:hypothetical protein